MSGMVVSGEYLGLIDTQGGFSVYMFATHKERAEQAIRCTWRELDDTARAAWLRTLADAIDANAAKEAAQDAMKYCECGAQDCWGEEELASGKCAACGGIVDAN